MSTSRPNGYTSYRGISRETRPSSAELIDLHVYIVPPEIWRERYNNLLNQNVTETISAGIIRVHPERFVYDLRNELEQQVGEDMLPRDYVFLKSVGRSITRLKQKQEYQLKAKHFIPPQAYAPELYLLEISPDDQGSSRTSTRPHSPFSQNHENHRKRADQSREPVSGTYTNHTNEDSGINVNSPEDHFDALDRRKHDEDRNNDLNRRLHPDNEDDHHRNGDISDDEWERRRREEEERRRRESEERRMKEDEDRRKEEEERRRLEEERERISKQQLTGSDEEDSLSPENTPTPSNEGPRMPAPARQYQENPSSAFTDNSLNFHKGGNRYQANQNFAGYEEQNPRYKNSGEQNSHYKNGTEQNSQYGYKDSTEQNSQYRYKDSTEQNSQYRYKDSTEQNSQYGYKDSTEQNSQYSSESVYSQESRMKVPLQDSAYPQGSRMKVPMKSNEGPVNPHNRGSNDRSRAPQESENSMNNVSERLKVPEMDLNRFPSPPPLQMDSNQGQETESSKQNKKAEKAVTKPPFSKQETKQEIKERLMKELEAAREARRAVEKQREELVKKAKLMQTKTQNRRNHDMMNVFDARDLWKKRYFEEKKKTPPLEEQCNRLRHELDIIHRKLMNTLEGPSKEKSTRLGDLKPSQKNNYKIQATRLTHEIDDMRRRLENAKMKLTAEMKLRNQAETELRALRAELTQQKIQLTLARSQQMAKLTPTTHDSRLDSRLLTSSYS
nr:spermatogenesis-associated protein 1 isoform X10 [Crassostrea gigas]